MEDFKCPKCGQRHLRTHTKLIENEKREFSTVHYEWECGWCGHAFGDYASISEAKIDYNKNYGGAE